MMPMVSWVLVMILANGETVWQPRSFQECRQIAAAVSSGRPVLGTAPDGRSEVRVVAAACMLRTDAERAGMVPAERIPL